ncbi:hypothetical protein FRC11_001342, partial [Ceratobasidium sp. 423]
MAAHHTWQQHDGLVREALVRALELSQYTYVQDNLAASLVWEALREVHAPITEACVSSIRSQLLSLHMPEGGSFEDHLTKLQQLFMEMSVLGQPIPEGEQKFTLLGSLLPSWHSVVLAFKVSLKPLPKMIQSLCAIAHDVQPSSGPAPSGMALSVQADAPKQSYCFDCCEAGHSISSLKCANVQCWLERFRSDKASEWWKGNHKGMKGKDGPRKAKASMAVSTVTRLSRVSAPAAPKAREVSAVKVSTWSLSALESIVEVTALVATSAGDHKSKSIIIDSGCSHHI